VKRLADHKIIAWDFDDTLVGHAGSRRFQEFIKANPYGQEHHIVSFRSHGMEQQFDRDLFESCGDLLTLADFKGIHNVPDTLYEEHRPTRLIINLVEDPYLTWKGMICDQIGATVLVDDMSDFVARGCEQYGVLHIHPDEFLDDL
jgi:hypothetical protein